MSEFTRWLEAHGLGKYREVFAENDIGFDVLPDLDREDLRELGVSVGDGKRLMRAIREFCAARTEAPGAAAAPIVSGPEAERRQLTVMFCDLAGSSALSQAIDPEDLQTVLRRCHNTWTEVVERHGGYVARHLGDGVLAYFGYPSAHEHDAEHALRAGLDLTAATAALRFEVGPARHAVRVGIATGDVVVGDCLGEGHARERAVAGETPNLAARLQAIAEPGSVVVSASTRTLTRGMFHFEHSGPHTLKGFTNPIDAWRVVAEASTESRFHARRAASAGPFVGRDEELALVLSRWRQVRDGDGHAVMISGEPGIGKSRLVEAVRERVTGDPNVQLRMQCSPYHANTPLYPVIAHMERAAGFREDHSPREQMAKLAHLLARAGKVRDEEFALLAELLSIQADARPPTPDLEPAQKRERTIAALVRQFETLASCEPMVAVFEDVHWSDPSTLELIGRLMARLSHRSAMLLITFRPEFVPPWKSAVRTTTLVLQSIGRRECRQLVEVLAGDALAESTVVDIVRRTDGVPLFIEELTSAVLEGTATELDERRSPPVASIPATLQDSLMARLDRLEEGRTLAQIGAVVGREFPRRLVAELSGLARAAIDCGLAELVDSGLVFESGSAEGASYTFKHALVRDTAYASLLRGGREALHAALAELLPRLYPERVAAQPELLAHHLTEAGHVAPAIEQWLAAGEQAARVSATAEAVSHFEAGLALLSRIDGAGERRSLEARLLDAMVVPLIGLRGYGSTDALRCHERAHALAFELEDEALLLRTRYRLFTAHYLRGDLPQARRLTAEFNARLEGADDRSPLVVGERMTAICEMGLGRFERAVIGFERVLEIYDPQVHVPHATEFSHDARVSALMYLSWLYWLLGEPERAVAASEDCRQWSREIGHENSRGLALSMGTLFVHQFRREPAALLEHASVLFDYCAERDLNFWAAYGHVMSGWARAYEEDPEVGLAELDRGLDTMSRMGTQWKRGYYLSLRADVLSLKEAWDEALRELDAGLDASTRTDDYQWRAILLCQRGGCLDRLGDENAAQASYRDALALAHEQGARAIELRAATGLASLWQRDGRGDEARAILEPVHAAFTEGFDTSDLRVARGVLETLRS